uniref:Ig-like domain-containing protein n=1 Tax=Poecilia latipinna TaxID=48699 RepID=A0A3B3TPH5_9TELE
VGKSDCGRGPELPPVSFKKELESQEAREGGETTLSCETSSPDCKVTWWKGSTVLSQGEKYTIQQRATTHSLVIHKLVKEDSGEYTCDTGDKKSTARLTIKGNCFCTSHRKKQSLENVETFDGGEALFECALSRPESKDCHWLLDGKPVKESPKAEIVSFESGRRHLLLLKDLHDKDSCTVTFKAGTASTSAQLTVKGEPSSLLKLSISRQAEKVCNLISVFYKMYCLAYLSSLYPSSFPSILLC